MPKCNKRKLPITVQTQHEGPVSNARTPSKSDKSRKKAKRTLIIQEFHTLNKSLSSIRKEIEHLSRDSSKANNKTIEQLKKSETRTLEKLNDLGGLDTYQKQSLRGQSKISGGDTSRWLIDLLFKLEILPLVNKNTKKLELLEVGALSPLNYSKEFKWIKPTCIDLNSQHKLIIECDFLSVPLDTNVSKQFPCPFDIISLSLVVNFEGDISKRGDMLIHAAKLLEPRSGLLFFVLPLPCISNSRYFNENKLLEIISSLGMKCIAKHHSSKLAYYLFKVEKSFSVSEIKGKFPKILIGDGSKKNNFCIKI
ncbi:hypothetical protein BB560_003310 [Smittium megazygosporum]|uniref:25S rRNA adenine-N(1) methyltransferase n=1 Tax=Smittium megazygosporum TaxID=133381 RepID=A0A2T9ZCC9_9FUNG|nr:hypothetical protein BB560_003310 [Smittium megazygosporum]